MLQDLDFDFESDHTHDYDDARGGGGRVGGDDPRCLVCGDVLRPDEAVICWDCRFANGVVGD